MRGGLILPSSVSLVAGHVAVNDGVNKRTRRSLGEVTTEVSVQTVQKLVRNAAEHMPARPCKKHFTLRSSREGAGFVIRRSIGSSSVTTEETDPFLMLDELPLTDYKPNEFPGAPWHPHRGMDTVMYVKRGKLGHEDSMGNKGVLEDGDCQWMTAASGIEHNEGTGHPGGPMHGFQCWINLPAANKMDAPAYNDMRAASIPSFEPVAGVTAKVIVGEVGGTKSLIKPLLRVQYIDFMCTAGASYEHALEGSYETCIVHIYRGSGSFGADRKAAKEGQCLLFGPGDSLPFTADSGGVDFLLLAGVPLREPVVWHGPFVMNSQQQIMQCFADYQSGKFIQKKATYRQL